MLLTVDGGSKMSARCLFFLDGGKREENPMSHTPLHRAAVLPLNTTPRVGAALGHSRAPLSRSATNRPTDRPTNQPLDSLESRRWHCVAVRRRLSPLPPPPPPLLPLPLPPPPTPSPPPPSLPPPPPPPPTPPPPLPPSLSSWMMARTARRWLVDDTERHLGETDPPSGLCRRR
ncbi:hypothetical protein X777_01790 [Ooceraea biroi]|uniref:Uncharacterized protein n=1 Tax=Ooceraea biroi TaxID=2015173 RepID=A0A026WQ11_OOCBI|nr:hypothetical protein X777_01790 [Ooceraea biroi]